MNRLPRIVDQYVEVEELQLPKRFDSRPGEELIESINGEEDSEKIDLQVGGYVKIFLSEREWMVSHAQTEYVDPEDRVVLYVDLVDARSNTEVTLEVDTSSGVVSQLEVARRSDLDVITP